MPQGVNVKITSGKLPQIRSDMLVALGGNTTSTWGSPAETIAVATKRIGRNLGEVRAVSRHYRTPAFPPGSGSDFVNAALRIDSALSAADFLAALHEIEAEAGRVRSTRWAARPLDLDLIACGDQILPDIGTYRHWAELPLDVQMQEAPNDLILPHPRLAERAFVLVPLADVAADWVHPVTGWSVAQMLSALSADAVSEVKIL